MGLYYETASVHCQVNTNLINMNTNLININTYLVFYNLNLFEQTTNEEQPSECNDFSFFSSLVFFPESNYGPGINNIIY